MHDVFSKSQELELPLYPIPDEIILDEGGDVS